MNVGVYYCANAVGRLVGTLASGALYSYVGSSVVDGFGACLFVSVGFAALSAVIDLFLHEERQEASWLPSWMRSRMPKGPQADAAAAGGAGAAGSGGAVEATELAAVGKEGDALEPGKPSS